MVNNTNFSDRQHVEASLIEYRSLKLGKNQKLKKVVNMLAMFLTSMIV